MPRSVPHTPAHSPVAVVNTAARIATRNGAPVLRARRASKMTGTAPPLIDCVEIIGHAALVFREKKLRERLAEDFFAAMR